MQSLDTLTVISPVVGRNDLDDNYQAGWRHKIGRNGRVRFGLHELYAHMPVVEPVEWGNVPIPPRWHSCGRMSRLGHTQIRGADSRIPSEVCPCGGYRLVNVGGGVPSLWESKNIRRAGRVL